MSNIIHNITRDQRPETRDQRPETRDQRRLIWLLTCFVFMLGVFISYRFVRHELNQNANIRDLQASVAKLSAKLRHISTGNVQWLESGYNYLAIGNSITLHGKSSFWWNEIGMAASDAKHDYFHLVVSHLEISNAEVMAKAFNFSVWEVQGHDRDETLDFLDPYLSQRLNLVTIQLAENASDLATYEEDYVSLIEYVKTKAPNARILVVGDFWSRGNRNELKINAVNKTKAEYVSLNGIIDNKRYYCGLNMIVYDDDGNEHIVEHNGVAKHPGDIGMRAIADRIIEVLDK